MQRPGRSRLFALVVVVTLMVGAAACGDSGDNSPEATETESGTDATGTDTAGTETSTDSDSDGSLGDTGSATGVDPVADARVLAPVATFPIDGGELARSVAVSPDGALAAVSLRDEIGEPVTIRIYDMQTGEPGAEVTVDAIGFSRLYWMGDDRLVAVDDVAMLWYSWDGPTLGAASTQPFEYECRATEVDRIAGFAYSIVEDDSAICRTDPDTGETVRSSGDVMADVESLWVRPGTAEVVAMHYTDEEGPADLLALDGADLSAGESITLGIGDQVRAVGATTWIDYFEPRESRLEPGSVPAPDIRDTLWESTAGSVFMSANGDDDNVYVSAVDGSLLGVTPAAWNPALFQDWSMDDSVMVRMSLDYQIERYEF